MTNATAIILLALFLVPGVITVVFWWVGWTTLAGISGIVTFIAFVFAMKIAWRFTYDHD